MNNPSEARPQPALLILHRHRPLYPHLNLVEVRRFHSCIHRMFTKDGLHGAKREEYNLLSERMNLGWNPSEASGGRT